MKKNMNGKSLNDIRRPIHKPTKMITPKKGIGYKRRPKHQKKAGHE